MVADEPQAAVVGRNILLRGGDAADAATAMAFALAVTLPSRSSLGGGGVCLASHDGQSPKAFLFLPRAGSPTASSERPAAVPMIPRGFYLLQLRYGKLPFSSLLMPAIRLAREGVLVSRVLEDDLTAVQSPLFADEGARRIFSRPDGSILRQGDLLSQPNLGDFIERLARSGVGDLYNGAFADFFARSASAAGGGMEKSALRAALPMMVPPMRVRMGKSRIWLLPPPVDAGLGVAAALERGASAQEVVAAWRLSAGANEANVSAAAAENYVANFKPSDGAPPLPALPASTSFVVSDSQGGVAACALTNNNLFGTGRVAPGTGVILASSPMVTAQPLLSAALIEAHHAFIASLASSGQKDAADALAQGVRAVLAAKPITKVGEGRLNALICHDGQCRGWTDPRGGGVALSAFVH